MFHNLCRVSLAFSVLALALVAGPMAGHAQSTTKGSSGLPLPRYEVVGRTGPDHAPEFTISVQISGYSPEIGIGPSKKLAEHKAAESFLIRENVWRETL